MCHSWDLDGIYRWTEVDRIHAREGRSAWWSVLDLSKAERIEGWRWKRRRNLLPAVVTLERCDMRKEDTRNPRVR